MFEDAKCQIAHKILHRIQNMEKHKSCSMPKPEVHVQCQKPEAYVKWYKHYNYVCLATIISENKANKKLRNLSNNI